MLKRTQDYLLSRRDGKGGFLRNPRALDSFGRAPDDITNAYIVWALTESGKDDDLTDELNALADQAKTSKDPYFLVAGRQQPHQPGADGRGDGRCSRPWPPLRRRTAISTPSRRASPARAAATCRSRRRRWRCWAG